MKIIKIFLIVLLVLILLTALGVFIFLKTFDMNRYKDQVTTTASAMLKRPVTIGDLDLNLSLPQGATLTVSDLNIKEGKQDRLSLSVDEIRFAINLMKFIRERELVVGEVTIKDPRGIIDLKALKAQQPDRSGSSAPKIDTSALKENPAAALPVLLVKTFHVDNGNIVLLSDGEWLAADMTVSSMDLTINGFSLNEAFTIKFGCAMLGADEAVTMSSEARLNIQDRQIRLDDARISSPLGEFDLNRVTTVFPQVRSAGITSLDGEISVLISQLIAGTEDIPVLTADIELRQGRLVSRRIPQPLDNVTVTAELANNIVTIENAALNTAGGSLNMEGQITDILTTKEFILSGVAQNIQMGDLIPDLPRDMRFHGPLNGDIQISGNLEDPADAIEALTGSGKVTVNDGRLENFNVLRFVLSQIDAIPGLADKIVQDLPQKYQDVLTRNDTLFNEIAVTTQLTGRTAKLPDIRVESESFRLLSNGSITVDQTLTLNGTVVIPSDLTKQFVKAVPELVGLVNAQEQLEIPLAQYSGPMTAFRPMPDLQVIAEQIIIKRGKDELRGLLKDVLGIEQKESGEKPAAEEDKTSANGETGQTEDSSKTQPREPDLIDAVFDQIF